MEHTWCGQDEEGNGNGGGGRRCARSLTSSPSPVEVRGREAIVVVDNQLATPTAHFRGGGGRGGGRSGGRGGEGPVTEVEEGERKRRRRQKRKAMMMVVKGSAERKGAGRGPASPAKDLSTALPNGGSACTKHYCCDAASSGRRRSSSAAAAAAAATVATSGRGGGRSSSSPSPPAAPADATTTSTGEQASSSAPSKKGQVQVAVWLSDPTFVGFVDQVGMQRYLIQDKQFPLPIRRKEKDFHPVAIIRRLRRNDNSFLLLGGYLQYKGYKL